ncbi:MAG TPA: gephyrin-like molybdotransferase Glp [Chloroflexota bacterium]|jgi:molybdopterin molybdotransferase|nr:gephyrin-like molybdotransferase Glp [Chloroflexota bacterium]
MTLGRHAEPGAAPGQDRRADRLSPLVPERLAGPAPDMISADEAIVRVTAAFRPLEEHQRVPLLEALGRVLVEDIPADIDVPPFDNSAMDGYAVRAADVAGAGESRPVTLQLAGEVAAGHVAPRPLEAGEAYRILTGAPLPRGADAVVPYEYTDGRGFGGWSGAAGAALAGAEREVRIFRPVESGENVRQAGEDQRRGEVVLRAGTVVRPAEVGVLASLGRTEAWVYRRPRVAVLSTGDEVVPVDQPLQGGQIRNANGWALLALIRHYGGQPIDLGIAPDRPQAVRDALLEGRRRGADLLLTSGGVSMGDYDVVKAVLQQDGEVSFWSIDVRPGKPLAFGHFQGVPLIGLPGNPVSSMVTFELLARPALLRLAGHTRLRKIELLARALHPITNDSGRENFMRGVAERQEGPDGEVEWVVRLTGGQGSAILTSMARANALVRVPKTRPRVERGESVRIMLLDWPPLN